MRKIIAILIMIFVATGCMAHKCDMKPKGDGQCSCQGCEHHKSNCDCSKDSCSK